MPFIALANVELHRMQNWSSEPKKQPVLPPMPCCTSCLFVLMPCPLPTLPSPSWQPRHRPFSTMDAPPAPLRPPSPCSSVSSAVNSLTGALGPPVSPPSAPPVSPHPSPDADVLPPADSGEGLNPVAGPVAVAKAAELLDFFVETSSWPSFPAAVQETALPAAVLASEAGAGAMEADGVPPAGAIVADGVSPAGAMVANEVSQAGAMVAAEVSLAAGPGAPSGAPPLCPAMAVAARAGDAAPGTAPVRASFTVLLGRFILWDLHHRLTTSCPHGRGRFDRRLRLALFGAPYACFTRRGLIDACVGAVRVRDWDPAPKRLLLLFIKMVPRTVGMFWDEHHRRSLAERYNVCTEHCAARRQLPCFVQTHPLIE